MREGSCHVPLPRTGICCVAMPNYDLSECLYTMVCVRHETEGQMMAGLVLALLLSFTMRTAPLIAGVINVIQLSSLVRSRGSLQSVGRYRSLYKFIKSSHILRIPRLSFSFH